MSQYFNRHSQPARLQADQARQEMASSSPAETPAEQLSGWTEIATASLAVPTLFPGENQPTQPVLNAIVAPITSLSPLPATPGDEPHLDRDGRFQKQVQHYTNWLDKQTRHDAQRDRRQEISAYAAEATRPAKSGTTDVAIFAPFHPKFSALQTFTNGQFWGLCLLGFLWLGGLYEFQLRMVTAVVAAVTVVYMLNLFLSTTLALRLFHSSPEEQIDDQLVHALKQADWPMYTILCPLYREAQVVPQFVQAMQALDYPKEKLQILFLTEENDAETRHAIRDLILPAHFKIIIVPDGQPRTKPRACNYGLLYTEGTYAVIYDAEDEPDPLQLKKAVLTFANHGVNVACVQAKLNFYNARQNLLTRWFTAEYSAWFDLILPGLQLAGFSLPLGGTSNHFRVDLLRALGAWDAYNVTEDCDLGLRLHRYKLETVILNSTTLEEANPQLKNWLRQRSRWIKGYMQTYLVHMRHPLAYLKKGHLSEFFSLQIIIGNGTGVMLLNPLMWLLLAVYVVFGPSVINVYHIFFPGPVLYLSAFCLIFGNFFYLYLYLLACMKRRYYHLLPWTLFIPIYWLLMSIAAFYAFYELLVKPHYWQKTVHGLHLKGKWAARNQKKRVVSAAFSEEPTMPVPVVLGRNTRAGSVLPITLSLKAVATQMMPAMSKQEKQAQQIAVRARVRDLWLPGTIFTACIISVATCWYFLQHQEILLYNDAYSHMRIARSVFDSLTPGLAQLGGIWLPLPHVLMLPFIWNDYLWHSGLAGSIVSMICYVISAAFLFLSVRRIVKRGSISYLGTLLFLLNPNILYLQSTPLSELVCIATFTMTGYFFLLWAQEGRLKYLALTAASVFLVTLTRYDGWAIFAALLVLIPVISGLKHYRWTQIRANVLLFAVLGGLGIVLWLIWNQLIFGDPLFFQRSEFSSEASQLGLLNAGTLYTYHNFLLSLKTYTLDAMDTFGVVLFGVAILAFLLYFLRRRITPEMLAILAFAVPFGFYVISLYTGQAAIWIPGAVPANATTQLYNVRYGSEMVAPATLFITILVARISTPVRLHWRGICQFLFVLAILAQTAMTIFSTGLVDLQDGQFGLSCAPTHTINAYLAAHYNGGKILMDVSTGDYSESETGLNFDDVIYDGSGVLWTMALANPAGSVDWVIVDRKPQDDEVGKHIDVDSPAFLDQFTLVAQESDGIYLYHRNDGAPLTPIHPVPSSILSSHLACPVGSR